jgi:hypothetical protein
MMAYGENGVIAPHIYNFVTKLSVQLYVVAALILGGFGVEKT